MVDVQCTHSKPIPVCNKWYLKMWSSWSGETRSSFSLSKHTLSWDTTREVENFMLLQPPGKSESMLAWGPVSRDTYYYLATLRTKINSLRIRNCSFYNTCLTSITNGALLHVQFANLCPSRLLLLMIFFSNRTIPCFSTTYMVVFSSTNSRFQEVLTATLDNLTAFFS